MREPYKIHMTYYRKIKGLSVEQAAKRAGISRQGWYAIEYGKNSPRLKTVQSIVAVLGVTVDQLLNGPQDFN